jgi:hypothetical protein
VLGIGVVFLVVNIIFFIEMIGASWAEGIAAVSVFVKRSPA